MKAIRLIQPHQPLELQELPIPAVGPRDVLVRVKAAGICHSDVHYRAGISPVYPLPLTLGHEIAGVVEQAGSQVSQLRPGDRVCLHYMVTCGDCAFCTRGSEQFCVTGQMLGKTRDGGYAEYISVPARNAFRLPENISYEHGAIVMCSSATSYHALRKSRLQTGESVAVFGVGGLGMSALQLARAFGALEVYAVDIQPNKLRLARALGAISIDARQADPVAELKRMTGGRGVDVALELIGLQVTMQQAFESLAIFGRAVMVGVTGQILQIAPYRSMVGKETELIGSSDHLAQELPAVLELARRGLLQLGEVVTDTVSLDAGAINLAMDRLEHYGEDIRTVITV
jgi:propanol-preferring alcohol dehydrogenase